MKALRDLCGASPSGSSTLANVQNIIGRDIERYGVAVAAMLKPNADPQLISLYGCFAARKLLELGCIAVLSRLDPARLLILREFQLKGKYQLDERHSAAIDWSADVISEKKPGWSDAVPSDKFVRSLLGGHMAEVTWISAIESLLTLPNTEPGEEESIWINELITQYEARVAAATADEAGQNPPAQHQRQPNTPELAVLSAFRTVAKQTFSTLSKGVHLEFVIDQATVFDTPTILQSMRMATKILTQIAFVSNLTDIAVSVVSLSDAIKMVKSIEKEME